MPEDEELFWVIISHPWPGGAFNGRCPCGRVVHAGPNSPDHAQHLRDAILASGYSKPRTVNAAADLDALPVGSVVLDGDGDPWKKRLDGLWLSGGMAEDSETVFWCGPTPDRHPTVLHEGSE